MTEATAVDRSVYADVEDERDYQRKIGHTEETDDARELLDFVALIGDEGIAALTERGRGLRTRFVRMAALAVAAVESLDRREGRRQ